MAEIPGNFKHHQFHKDLTAMLKKWAGHLSDREVLAVMAYVVGQTIALQDQRNISPAEALEIVGTNIDMGNKFVVDNLSKVDGLTRN